jgi:hypothetical protein
MPKTISLQVMCCAGPPTPLCPMADAQNRLQSPSTAHFTHAPLARAAQPTDESKCVWSMERITGRPVLRNHRHSQPERGHTAPTKLPAPHRPHHWRWQWPRVTCPAPAPSDVELNIVQNHTGTLPPTCMQPGPPTLLHPCHRLPTHQHLDVAAAAAAAAQPAALAAGTRSQH